jgi:hypothetical protein
MTTDILLQSEHSGVCPSGFITKEINRATKKIGMNKGEKVQQNYNVLKTRVRKPINQAKKLKNKSR